MNIQADIKWIRKELDTVTDSNIVSAIKNILEYRRLVNTDFDIEQYNKELEEADERISNGEYYTHDEVKKMSRKW